MATITKLPKIPWFKTMQVYSLIQLWISKVLNGSQSCIPSEDSGGEFTSLTFQFQVASCTHWLLVCMLPILCSHHHVPFSDSALLPPSLLYKYPCDGIYQPGKSRIIFISQDPYLMKSAKYLFLYKVTYSEILGTGIL